MTLTTEFVPLPLGELRRQAAFMKADGWRFMQTHAVNTDAGVDLYYSFMKDGHARNYRVEGVTPSDQVPSITDLFLAAFVFENEARELFGVDMRDIVLDFQGAMYAPSTDSPMTFISPEQKAAREKARKAKAAKAAKEAKAAATPDGGASASGKPAATGKRVFVMTPELQARLDAKMPSLTDEKKAKVQAALKARAAEAEAASVSGTVDAAGPGEGGGAPGASACAAKTEGRAPAQDASFEAGPVPERAGDTVLESMLAAMDAGKAAAVRAALEGRTVPDGEPAGQGGDEPPADRISDDDVARLLDMMDDEKAGKVIRALSQKGGE